MRSAFVDIARTRGLPGLYSGLSPTLVEIIPYAGLQFGTYDTFKRWATVQFQSLYLKLIFICGRDYALDAILFLL